MSAITQIYKVRDLERVLGIPAAAVKSLLRGGYVKPTAGRAGGRGYTFQDLIDIRAAGALRQAGISAQKINRALKDLRAALPDEVPLSGLAITASGDRVAVREGRQQWDARSGQYLLALEVQAIPGNVRFIEKPRSHHRRAARTDAEMADEWFKEGYVSETDDAEQAIDAYRRCLDLEPGHREARINLGRLLHLAGRLLDAERVYDDSPAKECDILFNLAVLLEDLGRDPEAVKVYREALVIDPDCADAHYNLARLHDAAGRPVDSLRHLLAYKRLTV